MRHRENKDKTEEKYYKGMAYCESCSENYNLIPEHIHCMVKVRQTYEKLD